MNKPINYDRIEKMTDAILHLPLSHSASTDDFFDAMGIALLSALGSNLSSNGQRIEFFTDWAAKVTLVLERSQDDQGENDEKPTMQ